MDYKKAYLHLMRACETARQQIEAAEQTVIAAQQWCEALYLEDDDSAPTLTRIK